ncbi:ATP-binding protein [Candidatus Pacearchaeota archaeon]|nr:ATP-binding protein [Candidatus Pacearchaeota archaeon]
MWPIDQLIDKKHNIKHRYSNAKAAADSQIYWDTIAKQIQPELMEEFPGYISINQDTFVKCIVVGVPLSRADGWPAGLSPEFQEQLLDIGMAEGCTISISTTMIQLPQTDALQLLEDVMFRNSSNREISSAQNPDGSSSQYLEVDRKGYLHDYEQIKIGKEKMFHAAFIVTIWSADTDTMYRATSHIESVLSSYNILKQYPIHRMLDTFLASLPFPTTVDFAFVQTLSSYARMLPCTRNPNSITDDKGLLFGYDTKTRKEVVVDLQRLPAQHMMIVGPTGSGKTYLFYILLMRAYSQLGKRVILCNPKKDMGTSCESVVSYFNQNEDVATLINIGPGGNNINPLQILFDEKIVEDGNWESTSMYDYQKVLISQFFRVWFKDTFSHNMDNYLDKTLTEVWQSHGIFRENPSSWKDADWPVFSDLREIWERDLKNTSHDYVTAEAMLNKTFILGTDGRLSYMNRKTDIDISKDFIVIDISNVPDDIQDAMNIFLTGVMALRFKSDTKKETIIAIDEARVFFQNPQLSSFILKLITQGRSFKIALWLATQEMVDLKKADILEEIRTNIFIDVILGANLKDDTIKYIKEYFNLSNNDISNLFDADVGEGIIKVNGESTPVSFKSTDLEHAIIKGRYNEQITSTDGVIHTDTAVTKIAKDNHFYVDDWIQGDSQHIMPEHGYEAKKIQNPVGIGQIRVWIKSSKLINNMVGNQSFDHYATVCIIGGYLAQLGYDITINHYDDVDIVAPKDDNILTIEYERPQSHHSEPELVDKKKRAEKQYGSVLFVGQSSNIKTLKAIVGDENAVKRGAELVEYIDQLISD